MGLYKSALLRATEALNESLLISQEEKVPASLGP